MFLTACIAVYGQNDATLAKNVQPAAMDVAEPTSVDEKITNAPVEIAPVSNASFKIIKRTPAESKVGPNGEDLIMKGHRFYYLDVTGKKVKVRKAEMKDMAGGCGKNRPAFFQNLRLSAHHVAELPVFGALLTAADRRVDHHGAFGAAQRSDLTHRGRQKGAVQGDNRTRVSAMN
jgi:hypothetical protein